MAKYVCNFEKVENTIKKLKKTKEDIVNSINNYNNSIENVTFGYSGNAKEIMMQKIKVNIEEMENSVTNITNMISFLEKNYKLINEAEEKLALLDI